ncbi:hypothetical protein ACIBG8_42430 [Nonomuraea sp. NPDC050556]|uniref:hypothetical protein n=1 Tax=Nonomuraea sp. NPDC050556 TaxID=3364369 RepID=UPI0037B09CBC
MRVFVVALVPAVGLRLLAVLGYPPALLFWADSFTYLREPEPGAFRPAGYTFFVTWFGRDLTLVVLAQHVLGLALAVAVYLCLRRRGLPDWGATLAAAPLLYDEFLVLLEHMVMADALFTVLVTAAVLVLLGRLTPVTAAVGGTLLGLAAITRTIGVPLLLVAGAWMLLRRTGWRPVLCLALAGALPLLGYATWMKVEAGTFGLTRAEGVFLWARTMSFADCDAFEARTPELCPTTEVRPAPPFWVWGASSPLKRVRGDRNAAAGEFARQAIAAQPGGYLAAVGRDLGQLFRWERTKARNPAVARTNPYWFPFNARHGTRVVEPYAGLLRAYQRFGYVPFPVLMGVLVVGLARRRPDALLPGVAALVLIVAPPFLTGYDVRYVVPAIPLVTLCAALAWQGTRLSGRKSTSSGGTLWRASSSTSC